jgi:Asp-tRNA(Asn)/Glu-tRNA(Gln) amidotransferase A subunit family amidase
MGVEPGLLDAGALLLRERLAIGALRCAELAEACVARIEAREKDVKAWAWFDPEHVRKQAGALDAYRATGRPIGPLHGLPVAVKDVIDTAGIPTSNGTPIDAARVPRCDAGVVERLKAAGALIVGKTVTTELAFMHPSAAKNPVNPEHTPGCGSAAAVAAGMVPLALGTQTAGSVVRSASYCGVVGFKPTFGAIGRRGVLAQAPSLDTVGVFARDPEGAALLAEALFGHDPQDRATRPAPHPRLLSCVQAGAPVEPAFALVRSPYWKKADAEMREAIEELADLLGERCFVVELPELFAEADAVRQRIQFAELAKCFYRYWQHGREQLSAEMTEAIEKGSALPARDYIAALDWADVLNAALEQIFERCDAILTPAAPGPAPKQIAGIGDPIFNGLWTLCRTPTLTLPLFEARNGLPMGAQLVGRRGDDGRLLRTGRWLIDFVLRTQES